LLLLVVVVILVGLRLQPEFVVRCFSLLLDETTNDYDEGDDNVGDEQSLATEERNYERGVLLHYFLFLLF
jgi:hypothetical protein